MKKRMKVVNVISLILVIIGLIEIIIDNMFCKGICSSCNNSELGPCLFMFMFVGIIFVVDGASLYLTYNKKKLKLVGKK